MRLGSGDRRFSIGALFLLAALAGCLEQQEPSTDQASLSPIEERGWQRNGSFEIPAARIGDLYRFDYDVEWHGTDVVSTTFSVREAPGPFLDERGVAFDPPAVLEDWRPGEPCRFFVLRPDGTVAASIEWYTPSDEAPPQDCLPVAWEHGTVRYGPYGLVENPERPFLFLSLAGQRVDGTAFVAWDAYLTRYTTYAWTEGNMGRIGTIGREHNGGVHGGYDMPPFEMYTEYEFGDAPVPLRVLGQGSKLGVPGMLYELQDWVPGDGPELEFSLPEGTMVLASGRVPPGLFLPADGLDLPLSFENATAALADHPEFEDWTLAHPEAWMVSASYDDLWVQGNGDEARPQWGLRFQAPDGATLWALVSLDRSEHGSLPEPLPGFFGEAGRIEVEAVEASTMDSAFLMNRSQVPDIQPIAKAVETAKAWSAGKPVLAAVRMEISDLGPRYHWPPEWSREMWEGIGRACIAFREPTPEPYRFGVTIVWIDLVTGWAEVVHPDADLSNC